MLCVSCDDPTPSVKTVPTSGSISTYELRFGTKGPPVVYASLPIDRGPPLGEVDEEEGLKWLQVIAIDAAERPLEGSYVRTQLGLEFRPSLALVPGVGYRATLHVGDDITTTDHFAARRSMAHEGPRSVVGTRVMGTSVVGSYPTADELPANQLQFYVHFSAPVRGGEGFFEHVALIDEASGAVERPWRRLSPWSADRKLVTLLIDARRGSVLKEGHRYSLKISETLRGTDGQPLASEYEKRFRVAKADVTAPDPKQWRLAAPKVGSKEPLIVEFGEPLDHVVLMTSVTLALMSGAKVEGQAQAGKGERSWRFVPANAWVAERHVVHVDPRIEDLAGNSTVRRFDARGDDTQERRALISMEFTP